MIKRKKLLTNYDPFIDSATGTREILWLSNDNLKKMA